MKKLFVFSILLLQTVWMSAQTITGKLVDQTGNGLSGLHLQLYINPNVYNTNSNADGSFTFTDITSVKGSDEALPIGYAVSNNFPNPFNPTTRIGVTLPQSGNVRIAVYNVLGQKVLEDIERHVNAGSSFIDLELNGLSNGFYIARIALNEKYTVTKKLMLIYGSQHLSSSVSNEGTQLSSNSRNTRLYKATQDIKIDSLVVTGTSKNSITFTNFPILTSSNLSLGDLSIYIQTTVTTTVDSREIGGSNLSIISFSGTGKSTDSSLTADVSKKGNQLLFVVDADNKVRGLTLSSPQSDSIDITKIDGNGTAAAMIFMVPGISTTDPDKYYSTLSNITSLDNFSNYRDYLKARLKTNSINDIVADEMHDSLLTLCVLEYRNKYSTNSSLNKSALINEYLNWFKVESTTTGGTVKLDLSNDSWRYVNVVRRDLDKSNSLLADTILVNHMGGAVPYSWGSLFTWTFFDPEVASVEYAFPSNVSSSELWIVGPGFKPSSVVPPTDIENIEKPWLQTCVKYALFPILDLWTGGTKLLKTNSAKIELFTKEISKAKPSISIFALANANEQKSQIREGLNLLISVLSVAGPAAVTAGIISASAGTIIGQILASGSVAISGANVACWIIDMGTDERYTKFQLPGNNISPNMVQVAGGSFTAGSTQVSISSFKIDKYEVTHELWTDVRNWGLNNGYTDLPVGSNGFQPFGINNPVTEVNWYDAVKWCNARSEKEGLTTVYCEDGKQSTIYKTGQTNININAVKWNANGYRLPTECEWEFAARGGTSSQGYIYSGSNIIDNVAWYADNHTFNGSMWYFTHTVGTKSANELGIYDMSGNVIEWCWDWYSSTYPSGTTDPKGPSTAQQSRILRGGSFAVAEGGCRVNFRTGDIYHPAFNYNFLGLRCVRK